MRLNDWLACRLRLFDLFPGCRVCKTHGVWNPIGGIVPPCGALHNCIEIYR